jgi:protein-S-isoprenylcysteine O-methyltransferase Ste14
VFLPLFALRPVVVAAVGLADAGSLWAPGTVSLAAGVAVSAPALWTFASVARYFGIRRALGVDHFDRDFDAPLVRRGAFAVVPNAMYVFGFLLLWGIAVATGSRAALAAAAFQHALIWAHYRGVERPDMEVIYEGRPVQR